VTGRRTVEVHVNGRRTEVEVSGAEFLLETLRGLGFTSVRGACGIGVCGTCTVLVDGRAVSSCLALTALQEGKEIVTSEGIVPTDGTLDEVQRRFVEHNAFQCSYCIPAMVLAVRAYLDATAEPTVDGARAALAGNLCRCGSYPQVLDAVAALVSDRAAR
jgi:aerobic-type carbon monoxide dehydrogenase small subunit (CoxS/CutS family)